MIKITALDGSVTELDSVESARILYDSTNAHILSIEKVIESQRQVAAEVTANREELINSTITLGLIRKISNQTMMVSELMDNLEVLRNFRNGLEPHLVKQHKH